MVMAGPMDTPINADILTLTQWLSPAYPVGGFAYSHGLEAAIEQGRVAGADQTGDWVATVLQHGSGWNDALFLVAAYDAADRAALTRIDTTARAMCAGSERLMETDLLGRAFGFVTGDIWGWTYSASPIRSRWAAPRGCRTCLVCW